MKNKLIEKQSIKPEGIISKVVLPDFVDESYMIEPQVVLQLNQVGDVTLTGQTINLFDALRRYFRTGNELILAILEDAGLVKSLTTQHNLIATAGRSVFAERLADGDTYTGAITHGALGDDTTTPANTDVALGNETDRFATASAEFDDNIAYIDFFIAAGTATGTHEEFGNFIDGTGTTDSGQLWSHILTGGWVKGAGDSFFISCQYTFTQ